MALVASIGARDSQEIEDLLTGMVKLNLGQLRRGLCPPLYQAGVRYKREPPRRERWQTALETFQLKTGDCEDLACYLAASLQLVGRDCRAAVIDIRPGLKHCIVMFPDGSIEDPSKKLGMRGAG